MFTSRPESAAARIARVCVKCGRIALTTWLSDTSLFKTFMGDAVLYGAAYPIRLRRRSSSGIERSGSRNRSATVSILLFDLAFEKGVSFYREPENGEATWKTFSQGYGPMKALSASLDEDRCGETSPFVTSSRRHSAFASRVNGGSRGHRSLGAQFQRFAAARGDGCPATSMSMARWSTSIVTTSIIRMSMGPDVPPGEPHTHWHWHERPVHRHPH
jgi:hypothetical protein